MRREVVAPGLRVLPGEQAVSRALRVATHIHCLLEGRTTLQGRPADVTAEQVEAAYFGMNGTPAPAGAASPGPPAGGGMPPCAGGTPATMPCRPSGRAARAAATGRRWSASRTSLTSATRTS